jgi:hypothetical protein
MREAGIPLAGRRRREVAVRNDAARALAEKVLAMPKPPGAYDGTMFADLRFHETRTMLEHA